MTMARLGSRKPHHPGERQLCRWLVIYRKLSERFTSQADTDVDTLGVDMR